MERMDDCCMYRRVLMSEVESRYEVDRGWMDSVKVTLGNRGKNVHDSII